MRSEQSNPLMNTLQLIQNNPLTQGLPAQRGMLHLAQDIRNRPIIPSNVGQIPFGNRIELIDTFRAIFVPTAQCVMAAVQIQKLLFSGLNLRNPLNRANRDFIVRTSLLKGQEISALPWWPPSASGSIVDGITGTGKSQLVERVLSLFPQVISHDANDECGWVSMTQLVYLKVHMPSDGSRGGFLELAFRALDDALGTNYLSEYSSARWTVEKLLVVFLHLLSVHRCGLLVIEEAQEKNLAEGKFGRDFVTFFLRILNWSIPTLIVGNPLAFGNLRDFSQDVDRFSEGGWHEFWPAMDPQSNVWKEDWIPGLWSPTLLDEPDAPYIPSGQEQTLEEFVWRRSAGVPRYVCRLRREVQEHALRSGKRRIDAEFVDRVYQQSPQMRVLHPRIEALTTRDWKALQRFTDIPVPAFREAWRSLSGDDVSLTETSRPADPPSVSTERSAPKKRRAPRATGSTAKSKVIEFQRNQIEQLRKAAEGKAP